MKEEQNAVFSGRHPKAMRLIMNALRLFALLSFVCLFIPETNPCNRLCLAPFNLPLVTAAFSLPSHVYANILDTDPGFISALQITSAMSVISVLACAAGSLISLGNTRCKRFAACMMALGGAGMIAGMIMMLFNLQDVFSNGAFMDAILIFSLALLCIILSLVYLYLSRGIKAENRRMQIDGKYKLFFMLLPVLVLTFVFSYLPFWGWRFSFFSNSTNPSERTFVGFQWFSYMFENNSRLFGLLRVLRNTLIMSGMTIISSIFPILFAVFVREIRSRKLTYALQSAVIIPRYIAWPVIWVIAYGFFSSDGFFNHLMSGIFNQYSNVNYLRITDGIWGKMLLWHLWKNIGWSSILYLVAVSGIDQQLYDAAYLEGANRWQAMRHVSIPALLPMYIVVLLISFSDILSNDMQQYLLFTNERNESMLSVLDLYVYQIGIERDIAPYSTVISLCKSILGLNFFFAADRISRSVRRKNLI